MKKFLLVQVACERVSKRLVGIADGLEKFRSANVGAFGAATCSMAAAIVSVSSKQFSAYTLALVFGSSSSGNPNDAALRSFGPERAVPAQRAGNIRVREDR